MQLPTVGEEALNGFKLCSRDVSYGFHEMIGKPTMTHVQSCTAGPGWRLVVTRPKVAARPLKPEWRRCRGRISAGDCACACAQGPLHCSDNLRHELGLWLYTVNQSSLRPRLLTLSYCVKVGQEVQKLQHCRACRPLRFWVVIVIVAYPMREDA